MISCREVTRTISSGELEAAAWPRRLRVKLHLLMCRHCRRYARQLEKLGAAARDLWGGDELLSLGVEKHQAAFSSGTWLTGTPLTYLAPW